MEAFRLFVRWVLLLGFIALGLLYMNGAMASLWAASGPAVEAPNIWIHQVLVHFGFSFASLASGICFFRVLKSGRIFDWPRTWKVWLLLLLVVVALGWPPFKRFLEIDSCLDLGGRWIYTHHECDESGT